MDTTDVTGQEIVRGDWVHLSVSMVTLNPDMGDTGIGQVIHVFSDSIHAQFKNGVKVGNSGKCFEKVGQPSL